MTNSVPPPGKVENQDRSPAGGIFRGSGEFIGTSQISRHSARQTTAGDVELNFVNTDIRDVVRSVLGELLKLNYTISPTVQGTMTLQTAQPLERSAVLPVLATALRLAGAAMVEDQGMVKVVPLSEAPHQAQAMPRSLRPSRAFPGFGVDIVPLKFVSAEEMQHLIEPLVPQGSVLRVDQARNLLVLAGTEQERQAMTDAVRIFDVDWLAGMSFALFPLKLAKAKTVAAELGEILGAENSPMATLVKLVSIDRMNAVLAISRQPVYLERLQTWIDRLDRGNERADQRIYVYAVQNGRAADLAGVLNKLTGNAAGDHKTGAEAKAGSGIDAAAPVLPEVAGSMAGNTMALGGRGLGAAAAGNGAAAAVSGEDGFRLATGGARIMADENNNALLILATAAEYAVIEAALQRLDIMPLQVMIEAVVAEVTLTNDLRYGLQYFFKKGEVSAVRSNTASAAIASQLPGFSIFTTASDIKVVLDLLESVTKVNVISSPQLMVLNNRTASLQVGDQVPVATQSAVSVITPGAPVVNTIQLRDTGVILKVTPRVNDSGLVLMEITQEVSDVAKTTTSSLESPTIQQRRISSSVAIRDGETVALGGLIRDSNTNGNSGIPALQDIPYLGFLFGQKTEETRRTELVVLITPQVVRNRDDARNVTDELRRKIRAVAPLDSRIR